MSEKENEITGISALLYSTLWQTREMGHLKRILDEVKINHLTIVMFFKDYKPGALLEIDGEKGDYKISAIDSLNGIKYDGAIIGKMGPVVKLLEVGLASFLLKGFYVLFTRKIRFKGIFRLFKFMKLLSRCAI